MGGRKTHTSLALTKWHQGDEHGLAELLDHHLPWIRSQVRRRLGPALRRKHDSMDVVQDAMVEFLRYGPRIQVADGARFRALLCRIIENILRDKNDWYKAKRRAVSREQPLPRDTILDLDAPQSAGDRPSQAAVRNEQQAWVRLCIECLPEEDREVIALRDWDGLTYAAIGERLHLSINVVRNRYLRAVDRLEKEFYTLQNGRLRDGEDR